MGEVIQFPDEARLRTRRQIYRRQFRTGDRHHPSRDPDRSRTGRVERLRAGYRQQSGPPPPPPHRALSRTGRQGIRCEFDDSRPGRLLASAFGAGRCWRSAALALLAGCGINGDFGEVNRTLVRDDIHDWVGRDDTPDHPDAPSSFELTDDERQLRDLAFPLIEPPYNRQKLTCRRRRIRPDRAEI